MISRGGKLAAVAYAVTWVVGLSIWPSNLAFNSSAAAIATTYRNHATQAIVQYLLVEGAAGLLVGLVIWAIAAPIPPPGAGRICRMIMVTVGATAVAVSLTECVIGLLIVAAAQHGHVERAAHLFTAVNRLDGIKMLLLAWVAIGVASRRSAIKKPPGWLTTLSLATASALVASGISYVLLADALSWTPFVSLPLLIVWVLLLGLRAGPLTANVQSGARGQLRARADA